MSPFQVRGCTLDSPQTKNFTDNGSSRTTTTPGGVVAVSVGQFPLETATTQRVVNLELGNGVILSKESSSLQSKLPSRKFSSNIQHNPILSNLDEFKKDNIKILVSINTLRGRRLKQGFPVRGQRTRSNAKTAHKLNRFNYN